MTTYYWQYPALNVAFSLDGKQNVVIQVPYTFVADNGAGILASISGAYSVTYEPGQAFVPYEDLTEAQVQAWTDVNVDVPALKAQLDAKIAAQESAPVGPLPPPWIGAPSPPVTYPLPPSGEDTTLSASDPLNTAPDVFG
jgi:hypothetical protein